MENRNDILLELRSIGSTLAELSPVNPYYVPGGYFDGFAVRMLELLKTQANSGILMNASENPYQVPDSYFEKFPEQVLSLVKSRGFSLSLNAPVSNPYQVPMGYFDGLAESILNRVKSVSPKDELESLSPLLSQLDKKSPFSTPSGYFEELTGNVVAGVKAIDFVNEELENLSPLMNSLKTENIYSVPDQYFDNLPATVMAKVKSQKPAKVVSMSFGRKMMRYATAAIVVGIIITAGVLFLNKPNSSVAPATIVQSEENVQKEIQEKLQGLSDDEILNFVENQTAPLQDLSTVVSSADLDHDAVKLMLADISDAELKQYLEEYSGDKEVLTN
jgi:hypothetical protein